MPDVVNIGASANDGTGDPLRTAMQNINAEFAKDKRGGTTTTLNVPGSYATVQAALDAVRDWTIGNDSWVDIQLAAGTYTLTSGINANHPFGHRIRIKGDLVTPANVIIRGANPPTFDALTVSNGHTLGLLDGITFNLVNKASAANNHTAVLALDGGTIICGPNVVVNNWYYGIAARAGSYIYCRSATVTNAGDVGIWAMCGSAVDCRNATVSGVTDAANPLGFGIQSEYGSHVDCQSANVTTCKIAGIASLSGSSVRANSATSSGNTGSGVYAIDNGTVEFNAGTASTNTRYGVEEINTGVVYYSSITAVANTLGTKAAVFALDNTTLGARAVASSGALRLDTADGSPIYFNTSGGLQFQIEHVASAVNNVVAKGATSGNAPVIGAASASSNADFSVQGKGTGSVFLGNQNANYIRINSKGSGSAPEIACEGDANLDLLIITKGTGVVRFGTNTAKGAETFTSYITIKDAGGTSRKLMVCA